MHHSFEAETPVSENAAKHGVQMICLCSSRNLPDVQVGEHWFLPYGSELMISHQSRDRTLEHDDHAALIQLGLNTLSQYGQLEGAER